MPKTRPRDIGTAAESAVLRVLRTAFPSAERSPLHGGLDEGDIIGTPFTWEVKGGHAAENASDGQIMAWLDETATEVANRQKAFTYRGLGDSLVNIGFLVTKRKGKGMTSANLWWAHLKSDDFARIMIGGDSEEEMPVVPVRLLLEDLLEVLRINGYTEQNEPPSD